MNIEILTKPFDKALIKRRQGQGMEFLYVEGRHYIQRLNEAFGGTWSFEIVEHSIKDDEVIVLGKLNAEGVEKTAFGGAAITRSKSTGKELSIADDLKAAATDALKKAATLFGIGLHLHAEDTEDTDPAIIPTIDPTTNITPITSGGNGNGNGRLTSKQLAAIWSYSRQANLQQKDVRRIAMEQWGKQPEFLSKGDASCLIDLLVATSHQTQST